MGSKNLVGALRKVERDRRRQRNRDLKLTAGAIATSAIDPIISIPTVMIRAVQQASNDADFRRFMRRWGQKLQRNPRAARFLAKQANDAEIKQALELIATASERRTRIARRAGAPKNPFNKPLNDRLRVLRRAKGR